MEENESTGSGNAERLSAWTDARNRNVTYHDMSGVNDNLPF